MELESQAVVRTEDGLDAGHVKRVVLDPHSKAVTHVVLGKGLMEEEKVIPLGLVGTASKEEVTFRGGASELEHLLPFEEKRFVEVGRPSGCSTAASAPNPSSLPGAGSSPPWPSGGREPGTSRELSDGVGAADGRRKPVG
jgi:sporulation protein YlmC with PRC-barrel domain